MGGQPADVLVPAVSDLTATRLRRVGHKGADHLAPGNTRASFDAALAADVDMIEFDVLPEDQRALDTTRLLLAHDYEHDLSAAPTLEEGLDHLASPAFAGVDLDVDLKLPGYEARVVRALQERDLVGRTLVSSMYMSSLVAVRALEPALRLGWSVPRVRRDYTKSIVWAIPVYGAAAWVRRRLPATAARHLGEGRCDAVMAHWRLITPSLVSTVRDAGGELYVWTVDDAALIRRLAGLGVTGVITNDPRLFA